MASQKEEEASDTEVSFIATNELTKIGICGLETWELQLI